MAGRGPAPKDPSRRARRNPDVNPTTVLRFERADPHQLPEDHPWPAATRRWHTYWVHSPQAEHFQHTDWEFLLTTALIHAEVWSGAGAKSDAAELRLREAKLGATVEDRLRLRMQMAQADEADAKRPVAPASRDAYADLRVVVQPKAAGE